MAKEYFAFISYQRQDEEWAIWLAHELEYYHLPVTLNGRDDLPKDLRPVFRDIDELSAGNLPKQIHTALQNSKNLVIICSPNASKSKWVNKEIEEFIHMGKTDRIFPFVVDGIPMSNIPDKECFPNALRSLSQEDERLGGNVNEKGRDAAVVKIVAGMLDVEFDMLWQRYEREKAEEEKRIREQRDRLLIIQSRFLSEKANNFANEGNARLSCLLALEALPKHLDNPERPYTAEAEQALRLANNDRFLYDLTEYGCSVNAKGSKLANLHNRYTIKIWDVDTGILAKTIDLSHIIPRELDSYQQSHDTHFHGISFAKKDNREGLVLTTKSIYFNSDDWSGFSCPEAYWLDIESNRIESIFDCEPDGSSIETPIFSRDYSFVVFLSSPDFQSNNDSNSSHCRVYIVKMPSRELLFDFQFYNFHSVSICPDNRHVVICSNNDIHILNIEDGSYPYKKRFKGINSCAFNTNGSSLFLNCSDNCIREWDLDTDEIKGIYKLEESIKQMKVSSHYIAISTYSGSIYVLDSDNNNLLIASRKLNASLSIIAIVESSGKTLISYEVSSIDELGNKRKEARFWDFLQQNSCEIKGWHNDYIETCSYSSDKSLFVAVSDQCISVWDVIEDKRVRTIQFGDRNEHCGVSKKYHTVVLTNWEGVWMLDYKSESLSPKRIKLDGIIQVISPIIFSNDESYVAFIIDDGHKQEIAIYNTESHKREQSIVPPHDHSFGGGNIAFSPDGKMIATSSIPPVPSFIAISIWDIRKGELLYTTLFECGGFNCSVCFSKDGTRIIIEQSYEWHYATPNEIKHLGETENELEGLYFIDGHFVKKHIPPIPLQELITQTSMRLSNHPLTPAERERYYLE